MTKTCTRAELSVKCDTNCLVAVEDRRWWYFVSTSGIIFFGGLLTILLSRLIIRICNSKRKRLNPTKKEGCKGKLSPTFEDPRPGVYVRLKEQAATLITAQTFKGRFLVILSFLLSMLYIVLYIVEATFPVEHCLDLANQRLWIFDVGFNVFFLVHFCLRFLAANDKLLFWFETLSIVDCFTIPEVFVSIVVRQNWLGLRFLRAMHFIRLADILQLLGIIHSSGVITLTVMVGNLFALLFTSGGILHLVENTGDPWAKYGNSRQLNYFECLYFLVVTMSTVGFGDIYAETYFGRIFMMIFISIGLGMFATYIPAILEYLGSHTIYHGSYKLPDGKKHIILCGYITKHSVEVFLRDFLHEDRSDRTVNIVIMGNFLPGAELESLIKKHFVHVSYFKGTVLSGEDCRRVKMKTADACIVLCNRECVDPVTEDAENIMRVVAIKNHCPGIRVIMQLLQYQNKAYLLNIPSWNPELGDDVVCISELKLGFIAQSCLSPGFSTLLANIFSMRTNEMATGQNTDHWMTYYIQGASQEMYTETLSMAFKGMAFQQAAEICFEKLGLLLIAIETVKTDGVKVFAINPLDKNMTIENGTTGYFITGSASEVKRAFVYCVSCHADIRNPEHIKECGCDKGKSVTFRGISKAITMTVTSNRLQAFHPDVHLKSIEKLSLDHDSAYLSFAPENNRQNGRASEKASESKHFFPLPGKSEEGKHGPYKVLSKLKAVAVQSEKSNDLVLDWEHLDVRNAKHLWVTEVIFGVELKEQQASENSKKEPRFDISGTFYWCEPACFGDALLTRDEAMKKTFSHHILVCLFNDKHAPLLGLRTLVIPLRASNLLKSELKTVVFLGNQEYMEKEWHQLCNFEDIYVLPGSPYCRADLRAVNANLADMVVFLSPATASKADDPKLADKESILASLNLKAMSFDDAVGLLNENTRQAFAGLEFDGNPKVERRGSAYGCNIPMITEFVFDQNVQYLDIDDDDDEDLELYVMQPFACGTAFTVSMLDSLMSATYFNRDILTLVRNLVTGGVNQFLEEHIAEGDELRGGLDSAQTAETRSRCKIIQISLFEGPLSQFGGGGSFGEMFLHALRCSSMICLGLYRFRDSNKPTLGTPSAKRYVICCPPYDFVLQPTDLVFVLGHSDPQLNRL